MYRYIKTILLLVMGIVLSSFVASDVYAVDFVVSNANVSDDNIISVDILLTNVTKTNCPDGKCYLQGLLSKKGSTTYFGFTQNIADDWIPYQGSPEKTFIKNNYLYCVIEEVTCSTVGRMKFNHDDPKYEGPGEYEIKFARYTGESNAHAGSYTEPLVINLDVATPTPDPTATPTPTTTATPTQTPTATPSISPTNTFTPKPTPTKTPRPSPSPKVEKTQMPEVMGLREEFIDPVVSPTPEPTKGRVKMPIIAGALVFGGIGFLSAAVYPVLKDYKSR